MAASGLPFDGFEAMLSYEPEDTETVLRAASMVLGKPRDMILEDIGTYVVSHPNMQVVRRLLRFGGAEFLDFLYSLEELPDRARLAMPDLDLPALELDAHGAPVFVLGVRHRIEGFGHAMVGVLRAMADDYGALVMLEHVGRLEKVETVRIVLADASFAAGRQFDLRQRVE